MPWNRNDYPEHWPEIVAAMRARADNRCEWCGVPNGTERMSTSGKAYMVVLTTAHLGVRPENLALLCQRCHLGYDVTEHIQTRPRKRRAAQRVAGQLELFESAECGPALEDAAVVHTDFDYFPQGRPS